MTENAFVPAKHDRRGEATSSGFACRLSVLMCAGYLLATVPPIVLDPLLTTRAMWGVRSYPHAGRVIAIVALLVPPLTFVTLQSRWPHKHV